MKFFNWLLSLIDQIPFFIKATNINLPWKALWMLSCLICSERRQISVIFSRYYSSDSNVFLIHILWIIILHNSIPVIQDILGFPFKAKLELILLGIVRICDEQPIILLWVLYSELVDDPYRAGSLSSFNYSSYRKASQVCVCAQCTVCEI